MGEEPGAADALSRVAIELERAIAVTGGVESKHHAALVEEGDLMREGVCRGRGKLVVSK